MTALLAEAEHELGWVELDHPARQITVSGELDLATYPRLVDVALRFHRVTGGDLTIDLSPVTFIDAGSLGALLLVSHILRTRKARLHIIGNARVQRVAELCGLESLLASYRHLQLLAG